MAPSKVPIMVPPRVWRRLVALADASGLSLPDLLVSAVEVRLRRSVRDALLVGLAVQGHPDRVIAVMTGEPLSRVVRAREVAGVEPGLLVPEKFEEES